MKISKCLIPIFCLVFLLFSEIQLGYSQLDTWHSIPPLNSLRPNQVRDHYVYLSTPVSSPFEVTIEDGSGTILATRTISNSSPGYYFVGSGQISGSPLFVDNSGLNVVLQNKGLILKACQPFFANLRIEVEYHGGWATSKGRGALGTTFRVGGFPQFNQSNFPTRNFTMGVMATEDNTTVVISDYDPAIVLQALGTPPPSITINLNKGECYVVSGSAEFAANLTGFMGALITSDKPIVLNNGNLTGTIHSTNNENQDLGLDLSVPVDRTGTDYILVEGFGNPEMEKPIVVAHYDNTEIYVNGGATPITTINAGDFFIIPNSNYMGSVHQNMYVRTSQPVYMYQALASDFTAFTGGLVLVPPFQNSLPKEIDLISSIDSIGTKRYFSGLSVITKLDATVKVNGIVQTGSEPVAGSPWETYRIPNLSGNVRITSTEGIAVSVIGRNGAAGFGGYFSGFLEFPTSSNFTYNDTCALLPTTFEAVFDSNFPIDSITWDFGDPVSGADNIANTDSVIHTYSSAGTYTVQLIVHKCENDTIIKNVTIDAPYTVSMPSSINVCHGDTVPASNYISLPSGAEFEWRSTGDSIGLGISGMGNRPSFVATNTSLIPITTVIDVIPIQTGCIGDSTSYTITVNPVPKVDFVADTLQLCNIPFQPFTFFNTTTKIGGVSGEAIWDLGDGNSAMGDTVEHVYTEGGLYDIRLTIIPPNSVGGCTNDSVKLSYVEVFSNPIANFEMNSNIGTSVSFFDESSSISLINSWEWNFGELDTSTDQNPIYVFPDHVGNTSEDSYNVSLIVSDINGCKDSIVQLLRVSGDYNIYVPNAFTPNNDGINDLFFPQVTGILDENYRFLIYNRWGEVVYESINKYNTWDATYKGEVVEQGVYTWKMEFSDAKGENYTQRGQVMVVR